jgi:hypothetical protein
MQVWTCPAIQCESLAVLQGVAIRRVLLALPQEPPMFIQTPKDPDCFLSRLIHGRLCRDIPPPQCFTIENQHGNSFMVRLSNMVRFPYSLHQVNAPGAGVNPWQPEQQWAKNLQQEPITCRRGDQMAPYLANRWSILCRAAPQS